jgi:hypothetical protein
MTQRTVLMTKNETETINQTPNIITRTLTAKGAYQK